MSREPQSASMRWHESLNRSGNAPEPEPPPSPQKKKRFKVTVMPAKVKPKPPDFARERRVEAALMKKLSTTEQLTAGERALLRELRSHGPDTADKAIKKIADAKKEARRP